MELAVASCSKLPHSASTCHCPAPELCVAPNCFQRRAWTPGPRCWAWLSCQASCPAWALSHLCPCSCFPCLACLLSIPHSSCKHLLSTYWVQATCWVFHLHYLNLIVTKCSRDTNYPVLPVKKAILSDMILFFFKLKYSWFTILCFKCTAKWFGYIFRFFSIIGY